MKTNQQSLISLRQALTMGLCVVGIILIAGPTAGCVAAKSKPEPVFSDVPDLTPPPVKVAAPAAPPTNIPPPNTPPPEVPAAEAKPHPATNDPVLDPQLVEQTQGKTLFSFTCTDLDLKSALATFARANGLNIVPDNDVAGSVTVDVRDLPLQQMMVALLDASDCSWREDHGLIRVRNTETRMFNVDYLRMSRSGRGVSSATLNTATAGGASGGGGGSSGGGGGGGAGGGAGGTSSGGSSVNLSLDNPVDFWKELLAELDVLLTERGRAGMAINKTAGLIQVTDRPSALKRVEQYLHSVDHSIHRQVEIEARIYDVTLNDQFQFGIDWVHVAEAYGGALGFGGATLPVSAGGATLLDSAVGGLNHITGGANPFALVFTNFNTSAAVNALKQQGNVEIIAKPRLRTVNNQTAMIKVGTEQPFFALFTTTSQSAGGNQVNTSDQITTVTVGTILSITPQISGDEFVSLDISPVLTSLQKVEDSPSGTATAPVLDTKQASTLLRVRDGSTVVLGGLIQTEQAKNDKKIPILGDIPWLGKLFTGTFRFKQKKELVIFVTPHIIRDATDGVTLPPEKNLEFQSLSGK